jgi:hypothetical protein
MAEASFNRRPTQSSRLANKSVNMKDAKRNVPSNKSVMSPLLSTLDRWIDNTVHPSASGGSTDYSSSSDEHGFQSEDETITFIEEDESAFTSNYSSVGSKLDRTSCHARRASPMYPESVADTTFSAVDRSIQSSIEPSVQSSMGGSSTQSSVEQSVQSYVEASVQQIYDTRELRKPKLSSRELFDKNRPSSIRERLMQGENRQLSEELHKSPNETGSAKGRQVPLNEIVTRGGPTAKKPKIWNKLKSKKWTKKAKKRSMHGSPSYEPSQDDRSEVTESVVPDVTTSPEAKAVVRTDSFAKSHASGGAETETLTKESSDLACYKNPQLSLPEKSMNPLSGDDDLASTQGYEVTFEDSLQAWKSKLSAKLSFLPWVKSEQERRLAEVKVVSKKSATDSLAREGNSRAAEGEIEKKITKRNSNKVVKSTIPANLPIPPSQKPDESQDLKQEEGKGKGEGNIRKADTVLSFARPRSFNPLQRSANKKSGKTANVSFSKDTKSKALQSASKGKPKTGSVISGGTVETCSTSHSSTKLLGSQEYECNGAPLKSSTQECSSPQVLEQPPPKRIPIITQKSETCSSTQGTMDLPTNREVGGNCNEQEDKLVEIALVPHPITCDVEPDDKIQTKGRSLQRKENNVRSGPARKRRTFGFLRKRLSQEVKPRQTRQRASTEFVPSTTQATSSSMPIVGDHQDNNSTVDREDKSTSNESHKTNNNLDLSCYSASTVRRGNASTPDNTTPSNIGTSPRKTLSKGVKSRQSGQRASAASVSSATQATSSSVPIVGDHQDNNSIFDREDKSKSNERHKTNNNLDISCDSASTVRRGNEFTPNNMTSSKIGASPTAEQRASTRSPKAPASTVSSQRNASPAAKRLVASLNKSDKNMMATGGRIRSLSCAVPTTPTRKSLLVAGTAVAAKQRSPLAKKAAHYTEKINARRKDETKDDHPVLTKPPYVKQEANELQEIVNHIKKKKLLEIQKSRSKDSTSSDSSPELRWQNSLLGSSPENGSTPKSAARSKSGSRSSRKKDWTVSDEKRMLQAMNKVVQRRLKELEVTGDDVHDESQTEVKAQDQGCWMGSFFQCGTGSVQQVS